MNHLGIAVICAALAVSSGLTDCSDCIAHQKPTSCWTPKAGSVVAGACPVVKDDVEPNNALTTAHTVPVDCSEHEVSGLLGGHDVDVYHAAGTLCSGSMPTASWKVDDGRLCLFAGCEHGLMTFNGCPGGGEQKHFVEGFLGCCIEGRGKVTLDIKCSVNETRIRNWIVVDRGDGDSCQDYTVKYHD